MITFLVGVLVGLAIFWLAGRVMAYLGRKLITNKESDFSKVFFGKMTYSDLQAVEMELHREMSKRREPVT